MSTPADAHGTRELELLGLGADDPDELVALQRASALLEPMLEQFLALDLSNVAIEAEVQYGRAPSAP